jgi:hypothetical protein
MNLIRIGDAIVFSSHAPGMVDLLRRFALDGVRVEPVTKADFAVVQAVLECRGVPK